MTLREILGKLTLEELTRIMMIIRIEKERINNSVKSKTRLRGRIARVGFDYLPTQQYKKLEIIREKERIKNASRSRTKK